jgi:basic membrane lipoprotein Med (substrate-binding protein (PBP1-ABC) superfamily)
MSTPAARVAAVALAIAAAIASGCERSGGRGTDAFRVALLTPGPISDGGWNASAYDGLMRIKGELGAEVSNVQTTSPAEFEQGFRDYARQGYDLVIGHGFEYQDAALKVGAQYPETDFLVSSGSVSAKNVASLTFHLDEATYLAGIVAASLSKSGKAGCVGGIKLPVILSTFDGFVAGAKSVKADFEVATVYTGSFEDVAGAKAATDALISQGADLVLQNADAAGLGVFQSAKEHGAYAFGTNRDQNDIAPETILASATIDIPRAFVLVAREVKEKKFAGRVIEEGLASGCVGFVWNPRLESRVPDAVKARVAAAAAAIGSGALKVRP